MAAIEREIVELVHQLDEAKQLQALEYVRGVRENKPFDFEAWISKSRAIRAEIIAQHGENFTVDVQSLLDQV